MNYRVTADLYFDDEIHTFYCSRTNLKVKVTPTASYLLREFLMRPDSVITYDELIASVWGGRGLVGSLAGLNNYVSQLRKIFELLSQGQVEIITIPKVGFKIRLEGCHSNDIDVDGRYKLFEVLRKCFFKMK